MVANLGCRGANMGELVAAELPLCYRDSMREGDVDEELSRFHREALAADMTHLPELSKGRRVSSTTTDSKGVRDVRIRQEARNPGGRRRLSGIRGSRPLGGARSRNAGCTDHADARRHAVRRQLASSFASSRIQRMAGGQRAPGH